MKKKIPNELQKESYHCELVKLASIKSKRPEKDLYSLSDEELDRIIKENI